MPSKAIKKMQKNKIAVSFFQRKPLPNFHFSVEIIFGDVKKALPEFVNHKTIIFKHFSQGIFKRLHSCWEAFRNQGQVNHITGDIYFVGALLTKKKTVQTILDCVFLEHSSGFKKKILKYFWLTMPVKRCQYITTISSQIKKEIVAHTNCNPDKIQVIPIAVSPVFYPSAKAFNSDCPNIVLTGSSPNKNLPRMMEAIKGLNCTVTVIGKQEQQFIDKLNECGLSYTYLQNLNREQMLEAYQKADLVMFVSTYEGFGMPIIEAQAVGVPVITSNISSMPEVAGNSAILADPYNVDNIKESVLSIINNKALRNDLIQKGFENVKRFNIDNIAAQYADVYQRIVDGKIPNL